MLLILSIILLHYHIQSRYYISSPYFLSTNHNFIGDAYANLSFPYMSICFVQKSSFFKSLPAKTFRFLNPNLLSSVFMILISCFISSRQPNYTVYLSHAVVLFLFSYGPPWFFRISVLMENWLSTTRVLWHGANTK